MWLEMERVMLGQSGISVARIGLGTWAIGGKMWGGTEETASIRTILAALDKGIDLIDTAPVYGDGLSEEIVGKAVREFGQRDRVVLATKCGLDEQGRRDSRPERIRMEVERSLKRLGTDYIDLYQIHWPDPLVPIEETAGMMLRLKEEGLVRAVGVSNYSPEQMKRWLSVGPLDTSQPPLNLFERESQAEVLPFCQEHGIATLLWSSLCRGLLTGKFTLETEFSRDDLRSSERKLKPPYREQYLGAVEDLKALAGEYGKTVTQFAVRWVLDQPGASVALWGARTPEQLEPVEGIDGWTIEEADLQRVEEILTRRIPEPVSGLGEWIAGRIPVRE